MASLIIDPRDQKFVLYEMLNVEELCKSPLYADFSRDMFDMALNEAEKFATAVIFPCLAEGDREGCRLEGGNVCVPKCYHRARRALPGGGLGDDERRSRKRAARVSPTSSPRRPRSGSSTTPAFVIYFTLTEGAAHLIEVYGTEAQKKKYLPKMHAAEWGGTMALTEPGAGTDVGNLKTKAIRQAGRDVPPPGDEDFHHRRRTATSWRTSSIPSSPGSRGTPRERAGSRSSSSPSTSSTTTGRWESATTTRSARSRRRWGSTARPPA